MSDVKSILSQRFEKKSQVPTKMDKLAHQTTSGAISSFSGVFKVQDLSLEEKKTLEELLETYHHENQDIFKDLENLTVITSEVKAIHNQAIILHGERIKKAQIILKQYRDGAFSAWLVNTYGNRQTPYNFLQYYEFYTGFPEAIQRAIDRLPKQVIYTLASREGSLKRKEQFILEYQGQTKNELLAQLREIFPLDKEDKRQAKLSQCVTQVLSKLLPVVKRKAFQPTQEEKQDILLILNELKSFIKNA